MKNVMYLIPLILLMFGCSSIPKVATSENTPDVVLSRADDLSSRPDYIKETEPFQISNGDVVSLGMTTIPADHRIEAAYRVAENNAKRGICAGEKEAETLRF